MNLKASQITDNSTPCWTACPCWQHSKHQSSTLLALCEGNPPVTFSMSWHHHAHPSTSHSHVGKQNWSCRYVIYHLLLNSLKPRWNRCHFADDILKCIFWKENVSVSIKTSLKLIPKHPINSIPTLVQIMAWRRLGDKPLSEATMIILLMHKCVTLPQWVNTWKPDQKGHQFDIFKEILTKEKFCFFIFIFPDVCF